MKFDIITLFPDMFSGPFDLSIIKRAREKKLVEINLHNLRDFAIDKRGTVDDRPYGGGVGMILRVEPIYNTLKDIHNTKYLIRNTKTVLLDPRGGKFTQEKARQYAQLDQLVLICGHYEGVDERVREHLVDESISIGDYVLTGGEIPATVIVDAVTRLLPGVLEKTDATQIESFSGLTGPKDAICKTTSYKDCSDGLYLEYPQYTRPEVFQGWKVPKVLLSGNHEEVKKWREAKH